MFIHVDSYEDNDPDIEVSVIGEIQVVFNLSMEVAIFNFLFMQILKYIAIIWFCQVEFCNETCTLLL